MNFGASLVVGILALCLRSCQIKVGDFKTSNRKYLKCLPNTVGHNKYLKLPLG